MKKLTYLVLDCETATLPFVSELAHDEKSKKLLAIARPLIYDIGWTMVDRAGNILDGKQFLIAETFSVPSIFNTAYYKEKRPLYLSMIQNEEIEILPWRNVAMRLIADLGQCDYCSAFNAMFDFKKAIPFTELYINKLYSDDYYSWENMQKNLCRNILANPGRKSEKEFDPDHFNFRGVDYPLADLWGMSCERLINTQAYKKKCFENGMLTASGEFFKTSAEACYRYCMDKYDFDEAHTALEDAIIESALLTKILRKGKIKQGIDYFPFRELGTTIDFLKEARLSSDARERYSDMVLAVMLARIAEDEEQNKESSYTGRLRRYVTELLKGE